MADELKAPHVDSNAGDSNVLLPQQQDDLLKETAAIDIDTLRSPQQQDQEQEKLDAGERQNQELRDSFVRMDLPQKVSTFNTIKDYVVFMGECIMKDTLKLQTQQSEILLTQFKEAGMEKAIIEKVLTDAASNPESLMAQEVKPMAHQMLRQRETLAETQRMAIDAFLTTVKSSVENCLGLRWYMVRPDPPKISPITITLVEEQQ